MMRISPLLFSVAAIAAPRFVEPPAVTANPNPAAPLTAVLRVQADQPVTTIAEVSDGKNTWKLRFKPERDAAKGLPIVGMRAARKHTIRVSITDAKGASVAAPEALEYTTPPLPADPAEFPPLRVTTSHPKKMEPGYTIFSPRRNRTGDPKFGEQFGMLVAVDAAGEPVWYLRMDSRVSDLQRLRNGNFAFLTQDYRAIEIDMFGNVVAQWYAGKRPQGPAKGIPIDTMTFHHDLDELPNGNLLVLGSEWRWIDNYYTSEFDAKAPRERQKVMGDEVVEFTRDGKEMWRWRAFDALDPFRIGYQTFDGYWVRRGFPDVKADFSHGNGVSYDPADDSVIVNFRMLSMVVKIDRKTKEIRWILGESDGLSDELKKKAFRLEPAGARWFHHQHAPTPTPRGTFMVFDNGNFLARPFDPPAAPGDTYSRAVEYRLDEKRRVARQVWVSEPKPSPDEWAYTVAMGDVDPMPKTGNVLVHYGMLSPRIEAARKQHEVRGKATEWTRIREFTRKSPAELVWEVVLGDPSGASPVGWAVFGGERVASLVE